jgi:hypothetical protein
MSVNQLHRILGVTPKNAWLMGHRIREAMRAGDLASIGGGGGIVERDETFIGHDKDKKNEEPEEGSRLRSQVQCFGAG